MPKIKFARHEPTDDWQQLQLFALHPEQVEYELIRPVVLFGQTPLERAKQTGRAERTVRRKAARFVTEGMLSLFQQETGPLPGPPWFKRLPEHIRQFIVELKAQYPPLRPNEIATICYVKYGRRPDGRTIKQVLTTNPTPLKVKRWFSLYAEIPTPVERRTAILTLHTQGWNIKSIAAYLGITRVTVYDALKRWLENGQAGSKLNLENRSHARKTGVRKVTLPAIEAVRKLQVNENLGKYRIHYALKQQGINLSPATCGRIMEQNQTLYAALKKPPKVPTSPKKMPFLAERRHQFWSVDVRYIEKHLLGEKPFYVISILENYSRCILASIISPTQDLKAFLMVLYAAIRSHGIPEVLVSDSGAIFLAKQAQQIYAELGIEKKQIAKKQAWQNLIETQFNVMRRMADYHFERAKTWEELQAVHEKWVVDFNYQEHWAHQNRKDFRHSPAAVLGWVRGKPCEHLDLARIFHTLRFSRKLNGAGYLRFRDWRLYGELGLARKPASVWLYKETLTIEFNKQHLADYKVEYAADGLQFKMVQPLHLYPTVYRSPQLSLWPRDEVAWFKVKYLGRYRPRPQPCEGVIQPPLFVLEAI